MSTTFTNYRGDPVTFHRILTDVVGIRLFEERGHFLKVELAISVSEED